MLWSNLGYYFLLGMFLDLWKNLTLDGNLFGNNSGFFLTTDSFGLYFIITCQTLFPFSEILYMVSYNNYIQSHVICDGIT